MRAVYRVRHVGEEVAADSKKHLNISVEHRVQRFDGVVALFLRWFKVELLFQRVQERLGRTLPDSHGAVTLYVRVPADAYGACAGAAYVAAYEQKIHNHRNIVDAIALLGDAETPCDDGFFRGRVHCSGSAQLVARQSTSLFDFFPAHRFYVCLQLFETFGKGLDEFMVNRRGPSLPLPLEQIL